MTITRTLGPIHFEDLEPHRFEDLVRQLAYDFRDWQSIEGIGRTGSDEGFDVRAAEKETEEVEDDDVENEEVKKAVKPSKLWLIQCKREKSIAPKKIGKYADEIIKNDGSKLYGVIFAAACDFSKKTRDTFFAKMRDAGVQEVHIWGKAELEDMLMQPMNDHLLFAYFGVSLATRRRSRKTLLRSKLSSKKKLLKVLGKDGWSDILIRNVDDEDYPFFENVPNFKDRPQWKICHRFKVRHDGLHVEMLCRYAYLNAESKEWDVIEKLNFHEDRGRLFDLRTEKEIEVEREKKHKAWFFWHQIPDVNGAHYSKYMVIPFENVIAIDEDGDELCEFPHIYVEFQHGYPKMLGHYVEIKTLSGARIFNPEDSKRIKHFPKKFPKPKQMN